MSRLSKWKKPRFREVGEVLTDTLAAHGPALLRTIIEGRASKPRPLSGETPSAVTLARQGLGSLLRRARSEGIRKTSLALTLQGVSQAREVPRALAQVREHFGQLPTAAEKTEFALLLGLYSASFLGGFCLGLQLPHQDLKLKRKGDSKSLLTLHEAPLLTTEVGLEWVTEIVRKARLHPGLNPEDGKQLDALERVLGKLAQGLAKGVSAQRMHLNPFARTTDEPQTVALDDKAYQLAETFFMSLTSREPK